MTNVDVCIKIHASFGPFTKSQFIGNQHHISASDCVPAVNIVACGTIGENGSFDARIADATTASGSIHRLRPKRTMDIQLMDWLYAILDLSYAEDDCERAYCIENMMMFPSASIDPSDDRIISICDGRTASVPSFRADGSESLLSDVCLFATCEVITFNSVSVRRITRRAASIADSPHIQAGASKCVFAVAMMKEPVRTDFSGERTEQWSKAEISQFIRVPDPVLRVKLINYFCDAFSKKELWEASEESIAWLDHRSEVFWGTSGPSEKGFNAVALSYAVYTLVVLSRFYHGRIIRASDGHLAFIGDRSGVMLKPTIWAMNRFLQNQPIGVAYKRATELLGSDRR